MSEEEVPEDDTGMQSQKVIDVAEAIIDKVWSELIVDNKISTASDSELNQKLDLIGNSFSLVTAAIMFSEESARMYSRGNDYAPDDPYDDMEDDDLDDE